MAIREITRRSGKRFQVILRGTDGRWISRVFTDYRDAKAYQASLKLQKLQNKVVTNLGNQITLDEYAAQWLSKREQVDRSGWRKGQRTSYTKYVSPLIGRKKLQAIRPDDVQRVLNHMAALEMSEQSQVHVFNLIRKVFGDAIELHGLGLTNPAILRLKPKVPVKEARHLSVAQVSRLLRDVATKPLGLGIWIQVYLGLRYEELAALTWDDVEIAEGKISVRRAYIRTTKTIRDYPKGGRQHTKVIPAELLELLRAEKARCSAGPTDWVVPGCGGVLPYDVYYKVLQKYLAGLGLPRVGTHGLRHSTSAIYQSHGATDQDVSQLFEHSSMKVTQRYIHGRGTSLERVAKGIRLFPENVA
jgi:integrase